MANFKEDSDDDMDYDHEWEFYRDRADWKDITPIPQEDENEESVVSIKYSSKFRDVYDYFRAIAKAEEKSDRALELTKDALELNPANYTVWEYRRKILFALKKDLTEEMLYIQQIIEQHPKNYQVWHHRQCIVNELKDGSNELEFTANLLKQDAKNYHAWQHRQWAMRTFNLFDGELDYVDGLLNDDIRNNSAWNQRYFVIKNTTDFTKEVLDREIEYTLSKIDIARNNESAWNYLRGIILKSEDGLSKNQNILQYCRELYISNCRSPYLLALISDVCEEFAADGTSHPWYTEELGVTIRNELAVEDEVRRKYWLSQQPCFNTFPENIECQK